MKIKRIFFVGAAAALMGLSVLACAPTPNQDVSHTAYLMKAHIKSIDGISAGTCRVALDAIDTAEAQDKAAPYAAAAYAASVLASECSELRLTVSIQYDLFGDYLDKLTDTEGLIGPWTDEEMTFQEFRDVIKTNEQNRLASYNDWKDLAQTLRADADSNWMKAFGELYPGNNG